MKFLKSGLQATVQDLGRYGYQKYGVIASGVMDPFAHRMANLLVGNKETEATLEITMLGPVIEFQEDTLIAVCGGDLSPVIDGNSIGLWKQVFIRKGNVLRFGQAKSGCRAYLAVAGGFKVPAVMESKSTYLRAGIGGYQGRALDAGDELSVEEAGNLSRRMMERLMEGKEEKNFIPSDWSLAYTSLPTSKLHDPIRVVKGRNYELFTEKSQQQFVSSGFKVTPQSDRMGYRLKGPELKLKNQTEMISEAVNFGTIQVPAEGNPIVLLADRQTTGGYPKIAEVASVDLPRLAQSKPGDELRFEFISLEEAQQLYLKQEQLIHDLNFSILLKAGRK